MAIKSWLFDSIEGDEREYSQEEMSLSFKHATASNGVSRMDYPNPLKVTQQPNSDITVEPGMIIQEGFFTLVDAVEVLPAPGYLQGEARTDRVVVRVNKSADIRYSSVLILQGVNGSAESPALTRFGNLYDMCLAELRFDGTALTVVDTRAERGVCGYIGQQYATAEQGDKADAALPAADFTPENVVSKAKGADGEGSGLDADQWKGKDVATPAMGGTGEETLEAARAAFGLGNTLEPLEIEHGGTGGATVAEARENLGLGDGEHSGSLQPAYGGTGLDRAITAGDIAYTEEKTIEDELDALGARVFAAEILAEDWAQDESNEEDEQYYATIANEGILLGSYVYTVAATPETMRVSGEAGGVLMLTPTMAGQATFAVPGVPEGTVVMVIKREVAKDA